MPVLCQAFCGILCCSAMDTTASGSGVAQRFACRTCSTHSLRARFPGQQSCSGHKRSLSRTSSIPAAPCTASMGIGFQPEAPLTSGVESESRIVIPKSAYGLSTRQIAALGISDPDVAQRVGPLDPVPAPFTHHRGLPCSRPSFLQPRSPLPLSPCVPLLAVSCHHKTKAMLLSAWHLCRHPCGQRHSMWATRWSRISALQPAWRLAQALHRARRLPTCHPCSWTAASATLACRCAASAPS